MGVRRGKKKSLFRFFFFNTLELYALDFAQGHGLFMRRKWYDRDLPSYNDVLFCHSLRNDVSFNYFIRLFCKINNEKQYARFDGRRVVIYIYFVFQYGRQSHVIGVADNGREEGCGSGNNEV